MTSLAKPPGAFKESLHKTTSSSVRPSPSPGLSHTPDTKTGIHDLKRKRPETTDVVYSQPANTGTGTDLKTQVTYAVEYLKEKQTPQRIDNILMYLSLKNADEARRQKITLILQQNHPKVIYSKVTDTYAYRPHHDIKSEEGLMKFLQNQHTAQGINVKDLRDGWLEAEDAINKLEAEGKLLVIRNKKDGRARMTWLDDPSLKFTVDDEFRSIWHQTKIPDAATVATTLQSSGQVPASKVQIVKKTAKAPEKKKKKARQGGKVTNKHMMGILKDYSHLKK